MNTLPWHELQAWCSDEVGGDWEETRFYDDNGTRKLVHLAGCQDGLVERTVSVICDYLVCVEPRLASECVAMDSTAALMATDVLPIDVPTAFMDADRYADAAARTSIREHLMSRQLRPSDAAWEQDSSRVSCPGKGCGRRFTLLNRRHHCRFETETVLYLTILLLL
jgi:hypothetical protein